MAFFSIFKKVLILKTFRIFNIFIHIEIIKKIYETALTMAIKTGRYEIVELLLKLQNIDVNIITI